MNALWTGGPSTAGEVRSALDAPLAYTTVLTILRNLEAKGAVGRFGEGRTHRYFPLQRRDEVRKVAVQRILDRFFSGSPAELLGYLTDARMLLPEDVAHAERRLTRQSLDAALDQCL